MSTQIVIRARVETVDSSCAGKSDSKLSSRAKPWYKTHARLFAACIGVLASVIAIIIGLFDIKDRFFDSMPKFSDEIALNGFRNERFLKFLERNDGKVVFINSMVDMSVTFEENVDVLDNCNSTEGDTSKDLQDGFVFNRPIVLPIESNLTESGECYGGTTIEIIHKDDKVRRSYGGTGILTFQLRGHFEIESVFYSGTRATLPLEASSWI